MIQEYFTVRLSTEIHLGLALEDMATVAQFAQRDICLVPGVAPFWYGVINFKGSLLWVLDCRRFFNLNSQEELLKSQLTSVVLTHNLAGNIKKVALVVQQLSGIISVDLDKSTPVSASLSSALQSLCTAVVEKDGKTICILNTEAFLEQIYQQSPLMAA